MTCPGSQSSQEEGPLLGRSLPQLSVLLPPHLGLREGFACVERRWFHRVGSVVLRGTRIIFLRLTATFTVYNP